MIPNITMLFGNIFNDPHITPLRLYAFGKSVLGCLKADNKNHQFDDVIDLLTTVLFEFGKDLGEMDTSIISGIGKRKSNDELLDSFKKTMSDEEPFIGRILGMDSTEYLDFYPHQITEYWLVNKMRMPILTNRVSVAATANAAQLGLTLTTKLKSYATDWEINRGAQEAQKGIVSEIKVDAKMDRKVVELALTSTIRTVSKLFPTDEKKGSSFFDFSLLFGITKHKSLEIVGTIEKEEIKEIANILFTDTTTINATNTSINADIQIYLSATRDGVPTTFAITIKPEQSRIIKPSHLGDLKNPFLLIKNTSTINPSTYKIVIKGK